jgi:hypothetical protein
MMSAPVARRLRQGVVSVLPQHVEQHDDAGIRRACADQDIHCQTEQDAIANDVRQHQDGEDSADDESDLIGCHADRLPAPRSSAAIKPTTIRRRVVVRQSKCLSESDTSIWSWL